MDYVFNYKPGSSFFHKLHPTSKILFMIFFTYIVLIQSSLIALTVLFLFIVLISVAVGISIKGLFSRLKWIIVIVVFTVIINILFNVIDGESDILFYLIPKEPIEESLFPIRRVAVYYAFRIAVWMLTLSNCGLIFLHTTSPKDMVQGIRSIPIPFRSILRRFLFRSSSYTFEYSLMIGLRYIPLVQDSTTSVVVAQKARGLTRSNARGIKRTWALIRDRLTTSLILIFKQIKTTSKSLELRGFGKFPTRTDIYKVKFHFRDSIFLISFFSLVIFLSLYRFGALSFIPPIPSLYQMFWM